MGVLVFSVTCSLLLTLVQGHSLFTCEPITISRCSGMPYNMTFFPNIMGHYDQDTAALRMEVSSPTPTVVCKYKHCETTLFVAEKWFVISVALSDKADKCLVARRFFEPFWSALEQLGCISTV